MHGTVTKDKLSINITRCGKLPQNIKKKIFLFTKMNTFLYLLLPNYVKQLRVYGKQICKTIINFIENVIKSSTWGQSAWLLYLKFFSAIEINRVRRPSEAKRNAFYSVFTKFNKGIRSGSCFNLRPIHSLKLIAKLFQILESQFLWVNTVTHCQITDTSFNKITEVLSRPI